MSLRTVDSLAIQKQPNCFSLFSSKFDNPGWWKFDSLNSPKVFMRPQNWMEVKQGSFSMGTHFGGDQTMQMYGDFDGFPLESSALFGLVI